MMKVVHIQIHEKLDGRLNETAFVKLLLENWTLEQLNIHDSLPCQSNVFQYRFPLLQYFQRRKCIWQILQSFTTTITAVPAEWQYHSTKTDPLLLLPYTSRVTQIFFSSTCQKVLAKSSVSKMPIFKIFGILAKTYWDTLYYLLGL